MVAYRPRPETTREQLAELQTAEAAEKAPRKAEWLVDHQGLLQELGADCDAVLNEAHNAIVGSGVADNSEQYFEAMENAIKAAVPHRQVSGAPDTQEAAAALDQEPAEWRTEEPPSPSPRLPRIRPPVEIAGDMPVPPRAVSYSAPVSRASRDWSSGAEMIPTQVKLTSEERECAAYSGVTDKEYAKQKLRLLAAKRAGLYQERG
jgi:hypothetical protein